MCIGIVLFLPAAAATACPADWIRALALTQSWSFCLPPGAVLQVAGIVVSQIFRAVLAA